MGQEIEILLEEYRNLKAEQLSRIGFRDNLIYVTLGAFGAVTSFVFSNKVDVIILLVIPWICIILGWTYLMNDKKITDIGKFIKGELTDKISMINSIKNENVFRWENFHSQKKGRKRIKIVQLLIDVLTFIVPGVLAIVAYDYLRIQDSITITILIITEIIFLIYLFFEIVNHSNF